LFVEQVSELFLTQTIFDLCADPDDNYLFDLAYQSNSDFLVSGDKKVLAVPAQQPLKILSLPAFKIATGINR
jgi:predicted nucleic acid-binding protein